MKNSLKSLVVAGAFIVSGTTGMAFADKEPVKPAYDESKVCGPLCQALINQWIIENLFPNGDNEPEEDDAPSDDDGDDN